MLLAKHEVRRHEKMHSKALVSPLRLKKKTAKGIKSKTSYSVAKAPSKDPLPSSIGKQKPLASLQAIDHLSNDQQGNDPQAKDQQANDQQANYHQVIDQNASDQLARNQKASKEHTCSACNLTFTSPLNFGRHMLEHEAGIYIVHFNNLFIPPSFEIFSPDE